MNKLLLPAALTLMAAGVVSATAQTYPSKSITIIVPFAAGGPSAVKTGLLDSVLVTNVGGAQT